MQRYEEFTEPIIASQGKRRYSTLYYPDLPRTSSDLYIITKRTDRLDLLANEYYGDSRYWVLLSKANKLHNGTLIPPIGFRLRIPDPEVIKEIQEKFTNAQF